MNGGWYSWASDPKSYRPLWRLLWKWSREEGLSRENILFNFCVNSEDLPKADAGRPSQDARLINCNQEKKAEIGCFTFEDYYPGDKYVDTVGITLYNWGQGARKEAWATWRFPPKIVNENGYGTLNRLKKTGKPIFLDEAGTTSIKYDGGFNQENLVAIYNDYHLGSSTDMAGGTPAKNEWLMWYHDMLKFDDQIIGGSYFNADVTNGLQDRSQIGELDWTALDPDKHFIYPAMKNLFADPSGSTDAYLYFDLPILVRKNLRLSQEQAQTLNTILQRIYPFSTGDIIIKNRIASAQVGARYQYFVEHFLNTYDPVMCQTLSGAFPLHCNALNSTATKQMAGAKKLLQLLGNSDEPQENKTQIALLAKDELDDVSAKKYIDQYIQTKDALAIDSAVSVSNLPENIPNSWQEIYQQAAEILKDYF